MAIFRKVPEATLILYDFFESEEQKISLVFLLGKNTGEAIQQTFFLMKKQTHNWKNVLDVADPTKN